MGRGKRRAKRNLEALLSGKQDKPHIIPGELGAYVDGNPTVEVAGRNGWVWVRLRGNESERVQAYNPTVANHYGLPVLVRRHEYDPKVWEVIGRDSMKYESYQTDSQVANLPEHGHSHSFSGKDYTGNDIVWVYKRQLTPLLPRPNETGTMALYIMPGYYYSAGNYKYWPGSGTESLSGYLPTGSQTGKFVTVSIEGDTGVLLYTEGETFSAYNPPNNITELIPIPSETSAIPIASIFLMASKTFLAWADIFDMRFTPQPVNITGSSIGLFQEGDYIGAAFTLDFGAGFDISISGTYGNVDYGVDILDDGILQGRVQKIDFGEGISVTVSGSFASVEADPNAGIYPMFGQPTYLDNPTGIFWKVPTDSYATGSLGLWINGVAQLPGSDYTEQYPASGTFQIDENLPTGSVLVVHFGVD